MLQTPIPAKMARALQTWNPDLFKRCLYRGIKGHMPALDPRGSMPGVTAEILKIILLGSKSIREGFLHRRKRVLDLMEVYLSS